MRELEREGGRDHNGETESGIETQSEGERFGRERGDGRETDWERLERERTFSALPPQGRESQDSLRDSHTGPVPVWWRDRNGLPQRSRRLWELESRTGGRGVDSIWEEAVPAPSAFSSPLLLEAGTRVLEQRRTRGPPHASAPQPPIQEAAPLSPPAQGARRASERTFRAFSCPLPGHYAAEQPSPSPPPPPPPPPAPPAARAAQLSAGGGVAQPSADGTLAARPQRLLKSKVGGGRRAPSALRGRCLASPPQPPRRTGGRGEWGRRGRGGEHHAVCILGHTANAPSAGPGRDGEPRRRGGRAQGQAAPEAR